MTSINRFIQPINDLESIDSLNSDAVRKLFLSFPANQPTLEEALRETRIQNYDLILKDAKIFGDSARKDPAISGFNLTDDEAGAIACYTFESEKAKPLYKIINECLAGNRNRSNLFSIKRFLYLLLSGLRKLSRFKPSTGQIFYRGIQQKVPQTQGEANGHQYYEEGRIVTWWGFTSTTTNPKATRDFIGDTSGTLFNIGGEDLWGYNIKDFSPFSEEEEILLEPEAKIKVKSITPLGNFTIINVEFQKFDNLVLDDVIAPALPQKKSITSNALPTQPNKHSVNAAPTCTPQDLVQKRKEEKCESMWSSCPEFVNEERKYAIDVEHPLIATKINSDSTCCTIIGKDTIAPNKVNSWTIKITNSKNNDGNGIYIGVASFDIDCNAHYNYNECGWYLSCYESKLYSGPPHNYINKEYGTRKENGEYIHTGNSIGVIMDIIKGELSFAVNGTNLGTAYEGIPLDKLLVPCVLLKNKGDSVEFDTSEVKENVNDSIPVPSSIKAKSGTWDSITLTWDVIGGASFCQIEADGNNNWDMSSTNAFTKRDLYADTEHRFRVRAVRGNAVSEWSDVVRGRTLKDSFDSCGWKVCPKDVEEKRRYSLNMDNTKIATKIGNEYEFNYSTIIGNTPIPLNKVVSWSVKILKSKINDGKEIYIGVAPFDIDQNTDENYNACGWYLNCHNSRLFSGPPNYVDRKHGPMNGTGECVHTGDCVSVVMDTTIGCLSYLVNGTNLGVAYKGVPLDRPLVPCVLLKRKGDAVEFVSPEVKERDETACKPENKQRSFMAHVVPVALVGALAYCIVKFCFN